MHAKPMIENLERRTLLAAAPIVLGDRLIYIDHTSAGSALMRSDLDGSNAIQLNLWKSTPQSGGRTAPMGSFFTFHDKVFFFAGLTDVWYSGAEPWVTDGTAAGTHMVRDIHGGAQGSNPHDYTIINDHLLFVATDNSLRRTVFETDGTWNGTTEVGPSINDGFSRGISASQVQGGFLYVDTNRTNLSQMERWKINGIKAENEQFQAAAMIDVDQVLSIFGSDANDQIKVELSNGITTVAINGTEQTFDPGSYNKIHIYAHSGDDRAQISSAISAPASIYGNNGRDTLFGGSGNDDLNGNADNDQMHGGEGDDTLRAQGNHDTLDGDGGQDHFFASATDVLHSDLEDLGISLIDGLLRIPGTDGNDSLIVSLDPAASQSINVTINGEMVSYPKGDITSIRIDLSGGADTLDLRSVVIRSTIYGGSGDDAIFGSQTADRIYGGDGNDWIDAGGGNDIVYGDGGNDRLFGGEGNDYLHAGLGSDIIRSGSGKDRIIAKIGVDDLRDNSGDLIAQLLS